MPIVDKLKEALKPGRKDSAGDGELGRLLAASAKKVLLQKIEFEPASRSVSFQLQALRSKYVLLSPRPEGAGRPRGEGPPARRQGTGACGGTGPRWAVTGGWAKRGLISSGQSCQSCGVRGPWWQKQ